MLRELRQRVLANATHGRVDTQHRRPCRLASSRGRVKPTRYQKSRCDSRVNGKGAIDNNPNTLHHPRSVWFVWRLWDFVIEFVVRGIGNDEKAESKAPFWNYDNCTDH